MYFLKKHKPQFLILLITILVFWILWTPGPRVSTDYHFWFPDELYTLLARPYLWRNFLGADGMGQNLFATMWTWYSILPYSLLAKIGIDFSISAKLLGIIPYIILGTYSITKFLDHYKIKGLPKLIASVLYLLNSYSILLLDGGQVFIAIGYAVFPLAFVYYKHVVDKTNLFNLIKLILAIWLVSILEIRNLILLFALIFVDYTISSAKRSLKSLSKFARIILFITISLVALHSYWIIPLLSTSTRAILPVTYGNISEITSLSFSTLTHTLFLQQPHWYENIFGAVSPPHWEFFLIPLMAFLPLVIYKKSKTISFWALVALLSIFFAKGSNPPLGDIYTSFYKTIPGLSLIRDSSKYFLLIALSYSLLWGKALTKLSKHRKLKIYSDILPLCYLLAVIWPLWTGNLTGLFSKPYKQDQYKHLATYLTNDHTFGRVAWIPTNQPLSFASPQHPQVLAYLQEQKRPFVSSTVGSYETQNYIREGEHMGEIYNIAGIKYLAYPFPDIRKTRLDEEKRQYYFTFLDQLSSLPWIESVQNFGTDQELLPLLKTKKSQDHFFLADNTWWIIGSDSIYKELIDLQDFKLEGNALIFAEEHPGLLEKIDQFPNAKILIYEKTKDDLLISLATSKDLVFPSRSLNRDPDITGWWKRDNYEFLNWRDFLQQKYNLDNQDFDLEGGQAVSEGENSLSIQGPVFQRWKLLYARVLFSPKGGTITFTQDGKEIKSINTKNDLGINVVKLTQAGENKEDLLFNYEKAQFHWVPIGLLRSNSPVIIKTNGDINVLNAFTAFSDNELFTMEASIKKLDDSNRILYWEDLTSPRKDQLFNSNSSVEITYKTISPTKYEVSIQGLESPQTLAFSESYDDAWSSNDMSSTKLYSLINGFPVNKDGKYTIYYTPQRYVLPGFAISLSAVVLLAGTLIVKKHNEKKT